MVLLAAAPSKFIITWTLCCSNVYSWMYFDNLVTVNTKNWAESWQLGNVDFPFLIDFYLFLLNGSSVSICSVFAVLTNKKITNFLHVNYEPNSTDGNNVLITSAWLHTRQYPESSYSWCKVQETSSGSPMCVVHFFCFHPIVSLWNSYPKCLMESCFLPFLCSLIQIHVWLWNLMFICQYLISCYSGR